MNVERTEDLVIKAHEVVEGRKLTDEQLAALLELNDGVYAQSEEDLPFDTDEEETDPVEVDIKREVTIH